jgi:hypothetical protein
MNKAWKDPAKRPPKASTMNTEGDFGKFTDFMRKVVQVHPTKDKPKPSSSSRVPAV